MKKKITLTKEQITYIDNYLKYHKIKYWDVRIELLDHIVSDVEDRMNKKMSFDDALIEAHKSFGNSMKMFWNSGIEYSIFENGQGYKDFLIEKRKQINRKYRKLLNKELKNFFTSINTLLLFFFLALILYFVIILNENKVLQITVLVGVFLYSMRVYLFTLRHWIQKKKEKSINLEFAVNYILLSMLLLNFLSLLKPEGDSSILNLQQYHWFFLVSVLFFFVINYCGYIVYKRTYKYFSNLYNKLESI
tara:strand:+ start:20847 stop:21590 length:744 start_codon:yes stop_codon:yes gene_type:complete